jgi:protein translocase SecG subunit
MTDLLVLAWLSGAIWGFLSVVVFLVSILLIFVILIQDSKDTGLTSAFGGAGGGNALLGARMQKELAKITAVMGIILAFSLGVMGFITANTANQSIGADSALPPPAEAPPTPGGAGLEDTGNGFDPLRPGGFAPLPPGGTTPPGGSTPPTGVTPPGGATLPGSTTPPPGASGAGSSSPSPGGPGKSGATAPRPPLNPLPSPIIPAPAPSGAGPSGASGASAGTPAPSSPGAPQNPPDAPRE